MNKKKKQEKGTLSSVVISAVALFVCAFALIDELGPIGIFATLAALVSFVSNLLAYLLKKHSGNADNGAFFGAQQRKPSTPVRRSTDASCEKVKTGKCVEIMQPKSGLGKILRERRNEVPDTVPVKRNVSHTYAGSHQPQSEDYTRRRLEQLKRFLDAGLIDKAEYETEKRKIGR